MSTAAKGGEREREMAHEGDTSRHSDASQILLVSAPPRFFYIYIYIKFKIF